MSSPHKVNWDLLGIAASLACAIHCALLPILISSLPLFGINIINNRSFENGMILLAFAIGSYSLFHGYRRHHKKPAPLVLFAFGIILLLFKQLWHDAELAILPFAVLLIVSAHLLNFRLNRRWPHGNPGKNQDEDGLISRIGKQRSATIR